MMFNPVKAIKNFAEKGVDKAKKAVEGMVPGGALIHEGVEKAKEVSNLKAQDDARKALIKALKSDASKDEIEGKLSEFKSTHKMKE